MGVHWFRLTMTVRTIVFRDHWTPIASQLTADFLLGCKGERTLRSGRPYWYLTVSTRRGSGTLPI
jgi:hypothetical protein